MTALKNIKDQISINSLKFKQPQLKISAVSLMKNINDLMDIILSNNLSNEDISLSSPFIKYKVLSNKIII